MIRSLVSRVAVGMALSALCAATLPLRASADNASSGTPAEYHYQTAITQVYGSQYPIAGHLDLQLFPNGIVRGYYHNAYQKSFIQVTGGRDGSYLWFDIGPTPLDLGIGVGTGGRLHVVSTIGTDNSFRGQLYPEFSADAATANPQPTGSDQYIFAAKVVDKSDEDYPFTSPSASP
jgi:hypothetical protein